MSSSGFGLKNRMHELLPVDSSLESLATLSLCTDQTDFTITSYGEPEYYIIDFPGGSIVVLVDAPDLDLCLLVPILFHLILFIFKAQMGQ